MHRQHIDAFGWCGLLAIALASCGDGTASRRGDRGDAPDRDTPGEAGSDAANGSTLPSCAGLGDTCGPGGTDDCCASPSLPGGTYYRSYDGASDGMYPDMSFPATVSSFRLDRYEVTVGRFRKFVEAGMGTQASPPAPASGAHPHVANSGWSATWNGMLPADTAALEAAVTCYDNLQTWTATPGANEELPINCLDWYVATAFCIWDGGYLPTEAEWNYAAAGGSEQRAYPWSNPATATTIDCSYANYAPTPATSYCVGTAGVLNRVGSESPMGDGKWGQADLGGNAFEWTLDWYPSGGYSTPCVDCANLTPGLSRVTRGGNCKGPAAYARAGFRNGNPPTDRFSNLGVRCARNG